MATTIVQDHARTTMRDKLRAFVLSNDDVGFQQFLISAQHPRRKAAWHHARLTLVQEEWKKGDVQALTWLRERMGVYLWTGLSVQSRWTMEVSEDVHPTFRKWHNEMLVHNDARGVFKDDPGSIDVLDTVPKLSWLIAAMQGMRPRAYPFLDIYYPGAFAYYEVLRLTGENPIQNAAFKDWILNNKHPGFTENFSDLDSGALFGADL